MNRFFIVRHGQTKWNTQLKTQGQQDSSLDEIGMIQTQKLAKRLAAFNIDHIYSSDLGRTIQTSDIISAQLQKEYMLENSLREIDFGEWEGLTIEDIKKSYEEEFKMWRKEPDKARIPGAESLQEVADRITRGINKINEAHKSSNILLVSHGVVIKVLLLTLLNSSLSNIYKIKQDNTALNVVEFREYGPVLLRVNDTTHLEVNGFEK
ncbi:phosphoglycerate mutase GpmB [Peptoclostridium acidaminophilum DSM 3953]|uniref:Phosphoglycerate mutase GpmB n=1 Tax=Peptoclostridium acidaminophilum DSM 3953 TaxID=1286171 RepID=W8T4K7_PEPAC|nr:histidine phosphatase family protein [Peptoclostridium acidaminophilum]AHM56674.1 phosphoglycerate mutase GpmB [Peptoclostridium acidaminophilum DSM 3953]